MLGLKLRPPTSRVGEVQRNRIIDSIRSVQDIPTVAIVAPPGYGKTTLLSQLWAGDLRLAAWLTLDDADSDPSALLANIFNALLSAGLIEDGSEQLIVRSDMVLTRGVNDLLGRIQSKGQGLLLLDQVDHLSTQASLDIVGALISHQSHNLQIILASRTGEGLPLARLRSQGALAEFGINELMMDEEEAQELFSSMGIDNVPIDEVINRTEGWPAGIYLTAQAIRAGGAASGTLDVRGDDIFLADYIREELLSKVPEDTMAFLIRSSFMGRLCGPLCDYVLETDGFGEQLESLKNSSLLIVPLDRTRNWYRYHSLLRDYLRSELERQYGHEIPQLHSRAATWLERNGLTELAIDHVAAAGEGDRFAAMVGRSARRAYSEGRMETISGWFKWLEDTRTIANHPELAAIGAFARGLEGDAGGSERMGMYALTDGDGQQLEDDALGPFALMFRSYQAIRGVDKALADARAAREGLRQDVEWIYACLGALALATQAIDGIEAADPIWADGLWRSESVGGDPFTSVGMAQRGFAAIARDDWKAAAAFSNGSIEVIKGSGLERYITSALGFTLAARVATRAGDIEGAKTLLASAAAIRPRLTVALPLLAVQNLHEMAKGFIEIADMAGARRVMRDASDIIAVRPRLGGFIDNHQALKDRLTSLPAGSVGASSLTTAELRLLPLLVTHLTYPEIGERLFVSRHTVKTQAMSIYRKLGVSSRADAVEAARAIGLLNV